MIASSNAMETLLNHDESGLIFRNVNNVSTIESYKILRYTLNLTSFLNTAQLFKENAHKILEFCGKNKQYEECHNFITNINEKIENYVHVINLKFIFRRINFTRKCK